MKRMRMTGQSASICATWMLLALVARAEGETESPQMEELGDDRYRIGTITVDKAAQSFSVPGRVLQLHDALEYLAVSSNGMKGYEALLELSTSPGEFNLACILIGLDDKNTVKPSYQFDTKELQGQAVAISVSWQENGETVRLSGANSMTQGDEVFDDDSWIYLGSQMSHDGKQFMAEVGGTLIGFVHDPFSVIEHSVGAGIGNYGLITGNKDALPPEGSAVTLSVTVVP